MEKPVPLGVGLQLSTHKRPLATCDECLALAVWIYAPSDGNGYYCDDCVPRGCSCNEDVDGNPELDDQGRELPCCEYWYDEAGWPVE